jgi:hypothetical protein
VQNHVDKRTMRVAGHAPVALDPSGFAFAFPVFMSYNDERVARMGLHLHSQTFDG